MKRLKRVLIFISILSLSNNISAQKGKDIWFSGEWRGTGFQLNNSSTWSIHFIADTNKKVYEIKYGTLGCSGTWNLLSTNKHLAQFQEIITDGISKCITGNVIIITKIDKKHITVTYFSQSGKLDAFSTLERTDK